MGTGWALGILLHRILQQAVLLNGFPDNSVGKESACNAGDPGSIPGLGRSAGEGIGHPLQHSDLENSMESIGHEVAESDTVELCLRNEASKNILIIFSLLYVTHFNMMLFKNHMHFTSFLNT